MAGYEYNPLLKLDLQKRSSVSPSDIEHIEEEISTINGDLKNKVPKFFTSIEELEIGEIGQYQGETTEEFTHGYFYERQNGTPAQYEDVTIPSGSKKLIYTNKFDQTQKIVYGYDTIALQNSVTVNYSQRGYVTPLNDALRERLYARLSSANIFEDFSIISNNNGLFYSVSDTLHSIYAAYGSNVLSTAQYLFDLINSSRIIEGFRISSQQPSQCGNIVDFFCQVGVPAANFDANGNKIPNTERTIYIFVLISDLANANWQLKELVDFYGVYSEPTPSEICFDDERADNYYIEYWGIDVIDIDGNRYVLDWGGGAGQTASQVYKAVSEDGNDERYIDINHLSCVFDSEPVEGSNYWAQAIDISLYFDYNVSFEDTTEAITIRRKIQQYDEYGFPIADVPTAVRRDAQPSLNPADFATAAQGAKADTALQAITHGTDGNYVTSTIGAKDANNEQSVSVSLTMQAISTASASAKGVAEASDVKDYIGNNTATKAQGTAADTALQQVEHGTDGLYITTTVSAKDANNEQTVSASLTIQNINTTDTNHRGLLEALTTRNYIDNEIYKISLNFFFYGVQWDENDPSPDCTRIGNMSLHAELPVQNAIVGGLLQDDLTFTPFPDQSDWSGETVDGSLGQVMVQIPKHYFKSEIHGTIHKKLISQYPLAGFIEIPMMYISAEKATVDRTDPTTPKLCSVVNMSAEFRGGDNTADWDNTYRSLLGKPATNISLTNFRQYARNRGNDTAWNCHTYLAQRVLYWLFVTEYATLNSQKPFNAAKDATGYMQGGLGPGVSTWNGDAWNAYNGYNPLIPCGYMLEYGNQSAAKNYSVKDANDNILVTFEVNSYRGVQTPFADIWDWVDGIFINVQSNEAGGVSTCYVTDDPAKFSSSDFSQYREVGNSPRADSWIKEIYDSEQGDIICKTHGNSSTSYYCDFYWGGSFPTAGTSLRGVRFSGNAFFGASCGFLCARSYAVPGSVDPLVGSRLCAIPPSN